MGGITDTAVLRGHTPYPQFARLAVHECTCGRCDKATSRSAMASGNAREFVFAGCVRWKDKSTILLSTKNANSSALSCSGSHVMFAVSCPLVSSRSTTPYGPSGRLFSIWRKRLQPVLALNTLDTLFPHVLSPCSLSIRFCSFPSSSRAEPCLFRVVSVRRST